MKQFPFVSWREQCQAVRLFQLPIPLLLCAQPPAADVERLSKKVNARIPYTALTYKYL